MAIFSHYSKVSTIPSPIFSLWTKAQAQVSLLWAAAKLSLGGPWLSRLGKALEVSDLSGRAGRGKGNGGKGGFLTVEMVLYYGILDDLGWFKHIYIYVYIYVYIYICIYICIYIYIQSLKSTERMEFGMRIELCWDILGCFWWGFKMISPKKHGENELKIICAMNIETLYMWKIVLFNRIPFSQIIYMSNFNETLLDKIY